MAEKETVTHHANILRQQAEEKVSCRYVCLCLAIFLILLYPLSAAAADKVRLQLKWRRQFLLAGNVDAMSTYVTDEPFELSKAGQEYLLYSPRAVDIDFYGDNLFATDYLFRI